MENVAGSISRLNIQAQCPGLLSRLIDVQSLGSMSSFNIEVQWFNIKVSYGSKNVQAQCPGSVPRLNVPDLSGIL